MTTAPEWINSQKALQGDYFAGGFESPMRLHKGPEYWELWDEGGWSRCDYLALPSRVFGPIPEDESEDTELYDQNAMPLG